jgi:hypothetical protein
MRLERQLAEHRARLTHVDATMRLFDPQLRPEDIRPRQQRTRSAWFLPGECLRLINLPKIDAIRWRHIG